MQISLLAVAHIVLAVLLIGVVLLQRSESSMGALGGSNAVFTGKSVSGILTKATAILATLFIAVSLLMVRESYHAEEAKSIVEAMTTEKAVSVEEQEPALPAAK
tara:strand:+ start:67 stop:378 length:312 start_codon:yes stop_codon:yes gene_type:complete